MAELAPRVKELQGRLPAVRGEEALPAAQRRDMVERLAARFADVTPPVHAAKEASPAQEPAEDVPSSK